MHLPGAAQREHGYLVSKPQAWFAFALSFLLMTFDFIDRQIVVSMFPYLKAEWSLTDRELGSLISIVSVTIALGTVPLSLFVDSWSAATFARRSNSALPKRRSSPCFRR